MGMTVIEKILARSAGMPRISPGDLAVVDVDTAVLLDGMWVNGNREILKLHDPAKVVVVFDHLVPAPDRASAVAHARGREFVRRFGITRFHDIGADQGISHVIVGDTGYALPGTVLVCADSHSCAAGAYNCAARGIGNPDMVYVVTCGKTWFEVGETVRYQLVGELPAGVSVKDLFLHIANRFGEHANQNVEFGGPGMAGLGMNARRTLATMGAELSAEFVTFEPDERLIEHIRARTTAAFDPQYADPRASYRAVHEIVLDRLEPLVARPDAVINNAFPVGEVAGEPIQQAFIGSCANGTLDDFADAARVLAGRRVAPGVRLLVTPGSQAILRAATQAGYVLAILEAGGVVTPATCGACYGGHMGVLGPGETCITASTRNFKGRMGDPTARIYMGSAATVAASAVAGRIADPAAAIGQRP